MSIRTTILCILLLQAIPCLAEETCRVEPEDGFVPLLADGSMDGWQGALDGYELKDALWRARRNQADFSIRNASTPISFSDSSSSSHQAATTASPFEHPSAVASREPAWRFKCSTIRREIQEPQALAVSRVGLRAGAGQAWAPQAGGRVELPGDPLPGTSHPSDPEWDGHRRCQLGGS